MTIALAILASGSGTNAQAMFNAVRNGLLDADIRLVVCNRPGAGVIARAADFGVPCAVMDHTAWPSREAYDAAVVAALREAGADTVALAGYMRMLSPAFLAAFPGRVLNIHPALLPAFPGVRGIADAHAWSVRITARSSSRPPCPTCPEKARKPWPNASTGRNTASIRKPCNGLPKAGSNAMLRATRQVPAPISPRIRP